MKRADGKIWISTAGPGSTSGINELDLKNNTIHPHLFASFSTGIHRVNGLIENTPGELLLNTDNRQLYFFNKNECSKKNNTGRSARNYRHPSIL